MSLLDFYAMIAIICVFYNPTQDNILFWSNFNFKGFKIFIIDNSSCISFKKYPSNTKYIPLYKNYGIAYAQNIGIREAKRNGYDYIIFFDQDSRPDINTIFKLKNEFCKIKREGVNIGAIGPSIFDSIDKRFYKGTGLSREVPMQTSSIISSGTFTSIEVINKVGGMANDLFIDYVDHEWCWRLKSNGYSVFISNDCYMSHKVGNKTLHFLKFPFTISAPIRYYFQYRNYIWLFGMGYVPKRWKYKTLLRKLFELILIPLIATDKITIMKQMIRGIRDGIKYYRSYNLMKKI